MSGYAAVFAVATLVTFFLTPRVRRFAESRGVVQPPDERRAHPRPTAALGGVAMFGGFIAALLVASVIPQFRHTVFADPREVIGIAVGATFIWGVGVADDIKPVSPHGSGLSCSPPSHAAHIHTVSGPSRNHRRS